MNAAAREEMERIMETICDGCHWPYVIKDQDEMTTKCDACQIQRDLEALIEREKAGKKGARRNGH